MFGHLPDGRCYLLMEWLPGETLRRRLDRKRLTLDETLSILEALADALEAAHDAGVVHRDVKPANVLLHALPRGRERVKLLDFGVALLRSQAEAGAGLVVGTPSYLSPEQARAEHVDGRADIYSLGVVAFEMLTGSLPFCGADPLDTIRLHLTARPPLPSERQPVPPILDELVVAMLDKQPTNRPALQTVRERCALARLPSAEPLPASVGVVEEELERAEAHPLA
jgi:serine/threonine-protein kinase